MAEEMEGAGGDIAATPNDAGDPAAFVARHVPADVLARYEVYSYRNAALILSEAHPIEFAELMDALRGFRLTRAIIAQAGGNESEIPKAFSTLLRPHGWHETTIQADLLVKLLWREAGLDARGKPVTTRTQRALTKARRTRRSAASRGDRAMPGRSSSSTIKMPIGW